MPESAYMHEAMADLCQWIGKSELGPILFGGQSMHSLCILQTEEVYIKLNMSYLRISPLFKEHLIEFRFLDSGVEDKQWSRIEAPRADHLIKRLIGFTKQIGWVNNTILLEY
ncbi:MAG: hypothetical protein HKN36_10475 [Hellea sp.]|nr:hypothetical protein [Hellea sp.]